MSVEPGGLRPLPRGWLRAWAQGGARAGGIPQPGSEASLVVVGEPGDGGGLLVDVIVTDDTPICRALRAAGLPAGVGLVAREPLRTGEAVVEYVGEVLTREQAEAREAWYQQQGYQCSYPLFTEQHGYVIDATLYGNAARFLNGSCEPNLKPQRMAHAQQEIPRVLFRAVRDIAAGEELTWRYHAAAGSAVSSAPATNEYARVVGRTAEAAARSTSRATARCNGPLASRSTGAFAEVASAPVGSR